MTDDSATWQRTVEHDRIRRWAAERDARPTAAGDGELRIERPGDAEGAELSWPQFFDRLAERQLAFRYRAEQTDGGIQDDYEFVSREGADEAAAKTSDPETVDSDQLATSDTGGDEPTAFDRVESEDDDADDTPMAESARGSVDASERIVLDEIHDSGVGPDSWQGSDEYIVLENEGEAAVDLTGWKVTNGAGRSYQFDEGTTLEPGNRLRLHSGGGSGGDGERYWDAGGSVWQASGDTVRVETETGEQVLTETYKGGR